MKFVFKNLLVLFLFASVACQSEKKDEVGDLKEEVIAIHDEVMPLMGELKSLKKEADTLAEQLSLEDSVMHQERIEELKSLSEQLDQAFDGMFVWMRQFKSDYEGMSTIEVKDYLLEQKLKVEKVNVDIKEAIAISD
jgi:DNA repair ATPase RecN